MIKKYFKSDDFRKLKLKFRQLIGTEPKFSKDINLQTENFSGWHLVSSIINENDIVYSIGICDDIGFDLSIIENKKVQLFAFDPTPYSVKWINSQKLPERFHFFPWAASGEDGKFFLYPRVDKKGKKSEVMYTFHTQDENRDDGVIVDAYKVESMMKKLEHTKIDLLKIDIEGAEYALLNTLLNSSSRPKQLLVEFHHRFEGIEKQKTIDIVHRLKKEGYLIAHISVTGRELSFIHKNEINS